MRNKNIPLRVLCIVGGMDAGGAETFLMKIYRTLDKNKYQMDFYCMSLKEGFYEKEINELGGRLFHAKSKSENLYKALKNLFKVVKHYNYKYVMRVSQHSLATLDLLVAKLGGASVLIQRSSNTDSDSNFSRVLHKIFNFLPRTVPNIKIAPSTEAAEYTFGKDCIKKRKAILIKNAIDVDQFIFNQKKRDLIRKKLEIENKFVVGHVGRLSKQKNHSYLIDIFERIYNYNNDTVLLLVGKGELENEIKDRIELKGLTDKVIFAGIRSDVPEIMMAMDIFIFPSFYEGMPNTVIEAQATGLSCVISDSITREVRITELANFKSIQSKPIEWAEYALEKINKDIRKNMKREFIEIGYDIKEVTNKFEKLIFGNES